MQPWMPLPPGWQVQSKEDAIRAAMDATAALAHQDHVPMADPDAGYLGVPFTQKEHEEEWMEMIDWQKLRRSLAAAARTERLRQSQCDVDL